MAESQPTTPAPFAWHIYRIDNEDGTFYVGATRNVANRMREHRKRMGRKPKYVILESGFSIEWRNTEHRWIERLRADGIALTNKTRGRNGTQGASAETRAKQSLFQKGRSKSVEHAEKIGAAQRGIPKQWSEEGRKRREATQMKPGDTRGAATRFKLGHSSGLKTRFTVESAKAHIGRKRSAESRKRMSEAKRKLGPERLTALMSNAAKARWAGRPEEERAVAEARARVRSARGENEESVTWEAFWTSLTPEDRSAILARQNAIRSSKAQ